MYNRNVTDKQISNCQYSEKHTNFLEHFLQRHVNIKNRICTLSKFRLEHHLLSSGKARCILMHISAFPYRFPSECTHCTCRKRCTMQTAHRSREPFRIGGQFGIGTSARVDVHSLKNMCTFACLCEGCFVGPRMRGVCPFCVEDVFEWVFSLYFFCFSLKCDRFLLIESFIC